jgi:hypothetical protein
MNEPSPDHLAWLALQYVCDELGDDERTAFELRLAEDQAAREAVAEAVEQCAAMRVVFRAWVEGAPRVIATPFPMPHASAAEAASRAAGEGGKPSRWRRAAVAASWMTAGAAASLLALTLLSEPSGDQVDTTAANDRESAALAKAYAASEQIETHPAPWDGLAWAEAGHETNADEEDEDDAFLALAADQQPLESLRVETLVPRADDWMLALVVSGMQPAEGAAGEGETNN